MIRPAAALGCAALAIAGCQQRDKTTIDLLRAGDAGLCIARDVEDTLRKLILPAGKEAANYTVGLADTTLEAFDKAVSRATCNTALTVKNAQGETVVERMMIDYVVAPSAQNRDTFLVSGATAPLRARIQQVMITAEENRLADEAFEQKNEALNAMVKPGWLIGRWVRQPSVATACGDGPFEQFDKGGGYSDGEASGRWSLSGTTLTIATIDGTTDSYIEAAEMNSLSIGIDHGGGVAFRRCSNAEKRRTVTTTMGLLEGMNLSEQENIIQSDQTNMR